MPGISRPFRVFLYSTLIVLLCALGWTQYRTNREVASPPEVLNPAGARGSALVVYHPGLSDFQQRVSRAFAAGLVAGGWRVELTMANRQARTDLTRYDLLAVGSPTYWWAPAGPLRRYIARLGDLHGLPTVVLITGAGSTQRSKRIVEQMIRVRNGTVVASYAFFTMAPNREENYSWRTNKDVGVALADSAGRAIPPPRP